MTDEKQEEVFTLGECSVNITKGGNLNVKCTEPVNQLEVHKQGLRMLSYLADLAASLPEEKSPKSSE